MGVEGGMVSALDGEIPLLFFWGAREVAVDLPRRVGVGGEASLSF